MKCGYCNKDIDKGRYCPACYAYLRKHPEGFPTSFPHLGELIFNDKDEAQCHICGLFFTKLGNHISFKHHMSVAEYKDAYKLYRTHSLCGEEYKTRMRKYTKKYYRRVVKKNLLKKGRNTRYKKGQEVIGRGKHISKDN